MRGRREDFVNGIRPPGSDILIFIGEQEFVGCSAAEYGDGFSKEVGFENVGRVFSCAVENEFFRVAFPAGG